MVERREVTWVELTSGKRIDSALLVCPVCKTLDLNTDIDTDQLPYRATCPNQHTWEFQPTEANVGRNNPWYRH